MNECLFFIHVVLLLSFLLCCLRMGKTALYLFIALQALFANLFVIKQIKFFACTATCSEVYVVSLILALNLLQEYYGKVEARKAVNISFLGLLLFSVVTKMHLFYEPALLDTKDAAFHSIFLHVPRIVLASFVAFFLSAKFDVWLYALLRRFFLKYSFILSMMIATILSQFLDTFLFGFLGLYKIVENILEVMVVSFLIRIVTIFCSAIFLCYSERILKKPMLEM